MLDWPNQFSPSKPFNLKKDRASQAPFRPSPVLGKRALQILAPLFPVAQGVLIAKAKQRAERLILSHHPRKFLIHQTLLALLMER